MGYNNKINKFGVYVSWSDCKPDKFEVVGSNPAFPTYGVISSVGRTQVCESWGQEFNPLITPNEYERV